ncbi:MAG: DoxX family protein [Cyanobacteria bacterium P01_D01_bin.116]
MTSTKTSNSLLLTIFQSTSVDSIGFQSIWLVARVLAGLLMIHNGLDKLADVQGFADNVVTFIGLPYPVFFTYCAAYIEIVAAVLLSVGLLTRLSALSLFLTMLVAIYFHLKGDGLQIAPLETASLYGLFYLLFLLNGGGNFSLDALLAKLFISKD